jgi:hypothetical protein
MQKINGGKLKYIYIYIYHSQNGKNKIKNRPLYLLYLKLLVLLLLLQINKKLGTIVSREKFMVTVYPNIDYAFIVALIVTLD